MTPEEVLYETAEKLTRQLAVPFHNDLTKFGNEKSEALKKLTQILTPTTEAESLGVDNIDIKEETEETKTDTANPRVKTQTPRVEIFTKKATFSTKKHKKK